MDQERLRNVELYWMQEIDQNIFWKRKAADAGKQKKISKEISKVKDRMELLVREMDDHLIEKAEIM